MAQFELDLDPVLHITVDAIGKPGERVFFIQGNSNTETITLLIEKIQLQSLVMGIEQFFIELAEDHPDLKIEPAEYKEEDMHIQAPIEPLFRVGELGIAYDAESDTVCLVAKEILTGKGDPEDTNTVRFWCTRSQLKVLSLWGADVISRGRPICPQCGQPMDPEGHFCPKKNGHNRE